MTHRIFLVGSLLLLCSVMAWADTPSQTKPDLQTAEPDFFDPTRKVQEDEYTFASEWRWEVGFVQWSQRSDNTTYADMYMNGARLGATVDFLLPKHFSVQTGALLTLTYGKNEQHFAGLDAENMQVERLVHNVMQMELTIPARVYYNINLWKKLNMFFYTGPEVQIGLCSYDNITNGLSQSVKEWVEEQQIITYSHDRYLSQELYRTSIQWSIGGGLEWDKYRLEGGYNFGLNNLVKTKVISTQHLWEWGWMVNFAYRF